MRGVLKRTPPVVAMATFVASVGSLTSTVPKPTGLAADDYMFVFVGHGDSSISGGTGGWAKSTISWPTYGYTTTVLHKRVTASDVSSTLTASGISSNGLLAAAWRGPVSASVMSSNGETSGSTLPMSRSAKNTLSLGQVAFSSDRDPSGTPAAPSGWVTRFNYTGVYFQLTVGDRIDGTQPAGSGTDTFTGYTASYPQVGFNIELRADDPTAFPAMSANDMGPYQASASNSSYGAAWQAFDQNNSTFWGSNPAASWLKIQFPGQRRITGYHVRNRTGFTNQTPTSWTFEGSNDDSSWTVLDTRSSVMFADGGENSYSVASPGSYRFYRLNIGGNTNNATIAVVAGLRFDFA